MNQMLKWLLGFLGFSGKDPAELAGRGDWRFGFVADHGNYVNLALLAVLAAMAWLIIRSYRREGHNPPAVKVFLSVVRIAVIVLVMAAIFRPAIVLRFTRTLYSTVLVLIDDSLSMSFRDLYADANSRQEVAALLNVPPADLKKWSRTDIARKALGRADGPLARLAADHPLSLLRFSTDKPGQEAYTRPLGRTAEPLAAAASGAGAPARPPADLEEALGRLSAAGHDTDLAAAIGDAIETAQGQRVAGIVIVSDGQMTAQESRGRLADALAYAAQQGARLYPVLVGDPTPPKNLSVTGLQAPPELRRGAHTEFTVVLAHRNLGGQSVTVKLFRRLRDQQEWTDTGLAKTVVLDGGEAASAPAGPAGAAPASAAGDISRGVQTVAIDLEPAEVGEFIYRAVVDPRPDEENPRDNAAEAAVKVSDEKIRVLLVSGDAGWEFQFLRNFLLRQPELYRLSVWQQNADREVNQAASTGMKLTQMPTSLEELIGSPGGTPHPGYDVIILYDPQPTEKGFDGDFVRNLQGFVERHGGGLCYIAGNKHTEAVLRSGGPYEPLANMLPVVLAANVSDIVERIGQRRPEPWAVQITSYGVDHPVTRLGSSADQSAKAWQVLPGIFWSHPVARSKPLARTLAVSASPLRRTARNEPEPVVVAQAYGRGKVLYVGTDDTWRWRFVQDGHYHRLFWSNVVRHLATLRARHVVIAAGGDHFSAGEPITVEVEAFDEKFNPLSARTFDVEMVDADGGETRTITLQAVEGKPGRFRSTIKADRIGTFELTALKGDPLAGEKVQTKRIQVELPKAEAARTEADRATMESIASKPDNFLPVQQIDQLARLIPTDRKTAVREVPWELWDTNVTLVLIAVLLTVEWIIRKKFNMA